jgi:hypothetical protein
MRASKEILQKCDSVEFLIAIRLAITDVCLMVRGKDQSSESKKEHLISLLKTINKRRNELMATDVNVERKSLKPPTGTCGGIFRQRKALRVITNA